ncbi:Protein SABRE [Conoideocrella luteorostrata]|uniref:Protein SABRE n=1 Tax=Conoideocrella luteorostrata TaxID=1105319 RepID=A0AAJ0CE48_9HYPO|nr:Protein SABRE [Conoideocrella luteorostrata]
MALLNPTFLLGVIVLLYLSSFVFFAVIRILTGVSIQRIGYLSLRRLAYTPRDGCRVEIRGLGLNIHRPTFAQPTWISLVLSELVITFDIRELDGNRSSTTKEGGDDEKPGNDGSSEESVPLQKIRPPRRKINNHPRTETWEKLAKLKDKIKKLHTNIRWLRMVDVVATNSTINVVGVGSIQVGSFTLAVDTRRKMVDHARLFKFHPRKKQQRQAEWIMTLRSILFTAEGNESLEVLDHCLLNVHGFLYESRQGLRDATISLKLGRVHVPYDDLHLCATRYKACRRDTHSNSPDELVDIVLARVPEETDAKGEATGNLMQSVTDSREFVGSILRGIKEVQFAVSYLGMTKKVTSVKPEGSPMLLNASMKEIGVDLHRLDPKSPAHRMYFSPKDIAHEALAAALSISVGIDDGHGSPERLLYIPMATTTVRTTLPSKTVQLAQDGGIEEKNANIMFANSVITSPSLDLDPAHLPLLIAMMQPKPRAYRATGERQHSILSRLLPKANIKFSMHEPVLRMKLKPLQDTEDPDDYDLIISSISSVSLDVESSHSPVEDMHYFLDGAMRLQSHHLYYQTCTGDHFNLMTTESFDLKANLAARPDINVELMGNIQSFGISMVRPEITDGLRQIVRQLRIDVEPVKRASSKTAKSQNFLRSMPEWLVRYQIEATDFNIEVAGVDEDISDDTRGVSVHLDSFGAEYRAHRLDGLQRRPGTRRRTHSRSVTQSDSDLTPSPASPRFKKKTQVTGDGRRLALHARGIEAQIVEAADQLEVEPFVNIPRLELAFSATSDNHGPLFHIQSTIKTVMLQYSLYRHYAVGVAVLTLRRAFMRTSRDTPRSRQQGTYDKDHLRLPNSPGLPDADGISTVVPELIIVDVKAALVQIKAEMPHEPLMMLRVYGLETGRHRWSTPFLSSKVIRLYVETPRMRSVWSRMIGIKNGRVDLRESKHKSLGGAYVPEKMIDVASEAIRVAIPHEVIVARITDNIINVIKSVQQLHHRFKTGTNEYILEKKPEGPKNVPKVSIRSRNFLFELEDGAFEWKLGMIYRTGREEQMQRLAREEAFRVKSKKVRDEEARKGGKLRTRSTFPRGRSENQSSRWFRSRSADAYKADDTGHKIRGGTMPRYDPDREHVGIHGNAKVSEEEARTALHKFNSQAWKKRIDRAYQTSQMSMRELRNQFWGPNYLPDDVEETENILEVPQRPALMSALISDLHFMIDKPTFALKDLPNFIHKVGKGMPKDMQYGLLVPMHVAIQMGEARMTLRDYPLPLLHIPGLRTGQSSRVPSVSLKANFVLAEEFRGIESTRKVRVNVVPPRSSDPMSSNEGSFAIEVRRTIGPVKSFSEVFMDINTALPTRITWGPCYQPAIQDMMMVIESCTKPQVDPSERVGFWDKLRLNTHSRVHVAWKGDGDMHLSLKGTRDPYHVTGTGAGFLMCWRNDVRWHINAEDNPKQFMTVDSGEYILAVPDYSHQIREAAHRRNPENGHVIEDTFKDGAIFKKVVMKLSGKVQWMAGLLFERAIENGERSFSFKPHYAVVLKNPVYAKPAEDGLPYDAMRGFRSRHIHLSIAVRAPVDRDWMTRNPDPSRSYNTVHLTPRFFTHFYQWWGLFSQPMSLPIRQGNLWPGREKSSKKFGRHLATVKYNLLLAPLFLSHIYKHKDAEDYAENAVSATGLKVRFDSFMLDLHQRREEFNTLAKGKSTQSRTSGIKIHACQLDLSNIDVRAVSASLKGTTTEAIKSGHISSLVTDQDEKPDLSRFTIPDDDFSWIDMDDFVELDWILPTEPHPDTKILPLAFAPRLTYFRQTDIGGVIAGDPTRTSPFGDEPTHFCIMMHGDDPELVQRQLIQERLDQLAVQIETHTRNVGEAELRIIQSNSEDAELVDNFEALKMHTNVLKDKELFLKTMLDQMQSKPRTNGNGYRRPSEPSSTSSSDDPVEIPPTAEFESEFKNRFVIHNLQLKWNNLLRNIVLRYIHQNSQRRGFVYYLSRPAIKFILDIVEEQSKAKANKNGKGNAASAATGSTSSPNPSVREKESATDLEDHIKSILGDGNRFANASFDENGDVNCGSIEDLEGGISKEFSPQSSYHVRLIAPQIQLQSEKNKKHVVMVTAKGMELKVLEVMDKERISDTVSGLVQRRFLVNMDSTQFFVTHQKWFLTSLVSMYAGSKYGAPNGSAWPPWVPMEVMFNFQADSFGFKRVVQKTSAMLRYDKYNNLRLKYNDEVGGDDGENVGSTESTECRSDNLWVEFPQARALCNSSQYYAMYVIVLDLLMYSEPLEKTRSERLEKIILASDFSDLSGTPRMVQKLQERIKQLEEIKSHFQVYSKYLDKKGWEDRLALERDLASCEDELFFMMKAITTSQRKYDTDSNTSALLKWSISARDIVWHLIQDSSEPMVELQLKDVEYDRTDNSDGSHMNLVRVGKVLGLNLLPDATYPAIIAPYHDLSKNAPPDTQQDMIRVYWHMLEAIAGIPVMDRFEVNLVPMKVQLEREAGKRLFEYIFPGLDGDKGTRDDPPLIMKHSVPSLDEDDDESLQSATSRLGTPAMDKDSSGFTTRAGSLELRLRPTLTSNNGQERSPKKALSVNTGEGHAFRLFRSGHTGKTVLSKKPSHESLRTTNTPRPGGMVRSSTGLSSKESKESAESRKTSRWRGGKSQADEKQQSDDLTKMINRASNFMTFAYIRMPSVVLCLSYKGKDQRNFEDVHDFVFRLPTIEWQNKTWSNLDLALALKKAVVKALISHTGAIIGNKFSKHRPNAEQRSKLREMANSSVLITPSSSSQHYAGSINDSDDSSSFYGTSPVDYSRSPPRSTRGSTHSSIPAPRSASRSSSVASGRSYRTGGSAHTGPSVPAFLSMTTPPTPIEGRAEAGLGIDQFRPSSSGGFHGSNHRKVLRSIGGGDSRPATSAGSPESGSSRKSGSGGLRDRLSAFAGRKRESSGLQDETADAAAGDDESVKDGKTPRGKRLSWVQGRTKTG